MLDQIVALVNQKKFEQAREQCLALLAQNQSSSELMFLLGISELQLGHRADGVSRLNRCIELAPANPQAYFKVADIFQQIGLIDRAVAAFEAGLAINPNDLERQYNLGKLYRQAGKTDQAIKAYESLLEKGANPIAIETKLCEIYTDIGQWAKVRETCERILRMMPDNSHAQIRHAEALVILGEVDLALAEFKRIPSSQDWSEANRRYVNDAIDAATRIVSLRQSAQLQDYFRKISVPSNELIATDIRDDWERSAVEEIQKQLGPSSKHGAIVFFHASAGSVHPMFKGAAVDYDSAVTASPAFALRSNSGARIVFVTDADTDLPGLPGEIEIVRLPVRRDQLMYSRMRSYRALAMSGALTGPIAFLDTDVCVNKDIREIFDGSFDIGVTYRMHSGFADMPLNEGVLLASDASGPYVRSFFGTCLNLYEIIAEDPYIKQRYDFDVRNWRGGQLSLAAFVDWKVPPQVDTMRTVRGITLKHFNCDDVNYAVRNNDSFELLRQKWAVHFKGVAPKQALMPYINYCAQAERAHS